MMRLGDIVMWAILGDWINKPYFQSQQTNELGDFPGLTTKFEVKTLGVQ